jgi:hypothetical protein
VWPIIKTAVELGRYVDKPPTEATRSQLARELNGLLKVCLTTEGASDEDLFVTVDFSDDGEIAVGLDHLHIGSHRTILWTYLDMWLDSKISPKSFAQWYAWTVQAPVKGIN